MRADVSSKAMIDDLSNVAHIELQGCLAIITNTLHKTVKGYVNDLPAVPWVLVFCASRNFMLN